MDPAIAWARSTHTSAFLDLKFVPHVTNCRFVIQYGFLRNVPHHHQSFLEFQSLPCEGNENWGEQNVYTLWEKGPLMVKLTPVKVS